MANVTFHQTEDSAATVTGSFHTVVVVDTGCVVEVMKPPVTNYRRALINEDWRTVAEFAAYSAAINFAKRYADGAAT